MKPVLEARGLCKSFRRGGFSPSIPVLKGLSFALPESSVTGFLGPNGAGKSTAFKCLLGLAKRDAGEVRFFGAPLAPRAKAKIGFLPEQPQFFEELSAWEQLLYLGRLSQPSESEALKKRISHLLKKAGLFARRHQRLKAFSKGMIQKIGLIQAFLCDPQILILDEPFSGLDPEGRFFAADLIEGARRQGRSVLFSSHILQDVERACDRLVIIQEGRIVFQGGFSELPHLGESRQILYLLKGKRLMHESSSLEECQSALRKILAQKGEILSVQTKAGDLEAAYMKLASGGAAGRPKSAAERE